MPGEKTFWPLVKTAIFSLIVPFTVGWWAPGWIHQAFGAPTNTRALNPWWWMASYPFFALGLAIYLWCAWDFAVKGLGTPAIFDAPRRLVIKGLYRYVRNPMYLGVLLLITSRAMFWQSYPVWVYLVCVATFFHTFVIAYEEPHLRKVFGEPYIEYCQNVRRWLPRFR